jgi:hypothetical protein
VANEQSFCDIEKFATVATRVLNEKRQRLFIRNFALFGEYGRCAMKEFAAAQEPVHGELRGELPVFFVLQLNPVQKDGELLANKPHKPQRTFGGLRKVRMKENSCLPKMEAIGSDGGYSVGCCIGARIDAALKKWQVMMAFLRLEPESGDSFEAKKQRCKRFERPLDLGTAPCQAANASQKLQLRDGTHGGDIKVSVLDCSTHSFSPFFLVLLWRDPFSDNNNMRERKDEWGFP